MKNSLCLLLVGAALWGAPFAPVSGAVLTSVPMQGGMVMPMLSYHAGDGALHVQLDPTITQLTPLLVSYPQDRFDPADPWFDALDPSRQGLAFSRRYGFVMNTVTDPLPAETGIWIRKLSGYAPLGFYRAHAMSLLLAANAPAPTIEIDEDDEFFLTLSNVGLAMRPDLADPHSVHWHGFPNAASIFDGNPDSSIYVLMGASLTYYYHAVDAGTYMYHCHVEATEHIQMGMVGNLYVRPRQNRLADGTDLSGFTHHTGYTYAYNDGDGSTYYVVEYPV